MKRVGVLLFQNMRYAPFLKMYQSILDELGVEYDIIYYNRDKTLNEISNDHFIPINWRGKGTVAASKIEKLLNFTCIYPRQASSIIQERQYDFLIVLTTFPAVLLSGILQKKYSKHYIVDIRDYTKEFFRPYYLIESKVLSKAALRIISSVGYKNFLPSFDYVLCHNMDNTLSNTVLKPFNKKTKGRIKIAYIGSISYERQCKQLIDLVCLDERFEFHFYGNEANGTIISEYIHNLGNKRIVMHGPFLSTEKERLYELSDIIFNCYGNDRTLVKYAISNKFYDGAVYRKPLLVTPNTSMATLSGDYAFALDLERITSLDDLYLWYINIDKTGFEHYTESVLELATRDNNDAIKRIVNVIVNS